jgi:hypothetical protein
MLALQVIKLEQAALLPLRSERTETNDSSECCDLEGAQNKKNRRSGINLFVEAPGFEPGLLARACDPYSKRFGVLRPLFALTADFNCIQ